MEVSRTRKRVMADSDPVPGLLPTIWLVALSRSTPHRRPAKAVLVSSRADKRYACHYEYDPQDVTSAPPTPWQTLDRRSRATVATWRSPRHPNCHLRMHRIHTNGMRQHSGARACMVRNDRLAMRDPRHAGPSTSQDVEAHGLQPRSRTRALRTLGAIAG